MSQRFNPNNFNLSEQQLNAMPMRDKIDIQQIIYRQLLATNLSASQDESIFAANVRLCLDYVPTQRKHEITDRQDEYESTEEHYEYKYFCGVPLGTVEHPINGSPYLSTSTVTNWHSLYEIILEVLEDCGLTWKFDEWQKEIPKYKAPIPEPTPLLENVYNAPVEAAKNPDAPQVRVQHCKICGDIIDKANNPGMHKYKKLICVKCEALADVKHKEEESQKDPLALE